MCISEWLIEDRDFRLTYQVPPEIYLGHSVEYLDYAESFSPKRQAASIGDTLVCEAQVDIAA